MSLALARKYRPKNFSDLIGQEAISQTLSLALDSKRLSHAYLFSGLRGSGKTSTARIFAKALICERGETSEPCEVCRNCIMANELRHIDIVEIDGASNRKIDNIRELIEHTKYQPALARYKIFIIDEVHMFTKEAFNALLKTVEEPPSFVKFILATTDPLKLPATILSRTQHFRFKKVSQPILVAHLIKILELEGIGYEREAIEIVARVGAGSVRDALTLLDQVIVYSKGFITTETVTDMLGIINPNILRNLINTILAKDRRGILEFIASSENFDVEMIIDELMIYLKNTLLSDINTIPLKAIEPLFRVLAEGKSLLNLGSSGEFVLTLVLFQMMSSIGGSGENLYPKPKKIVKELLPPPPPQELKREEEKKEKDENRGIEFFQTLQERLFQRNETLGECFKKNIEYISFKDGVLKWKSIALDEDRKLLKHSWGVIKMYVHEIFGLETKIKNIQQSSEPPKKGIAPPKIPSSPPLPQKAEDDEILKEPMVAKALELFQPKQVRIRKKKKV